MACQTLAILKLKHIEDTRELPKLGKIFHGAQLAAHTAFCTQLPTFCFEEQ